jgi:uncharacterized membrane protein
MEPGTFRPPAPRKRLHRFFEISILLKGLDGLLETLGGALFLFIRPETLNRFLFLLTAHELSEDPQDWIAGLARHAAEALSPDTTRFASLYLLGHGIVKIFLVAGLWREQLWAYPTAIGVLGAFIGYQAYRFSHTHSLPLLIFTAFDGVVVFLIWREYRARRDLKQRGGPERSQRSEGGDAC